MVKEGYKQTEIGVIPEDWDVVEIIDIVENHRIPSGIYKEKSLYGRGTKIIKLGDVFNLDYFEPAKAQRAILDGNELLIYRVNIGDIFIALASVKLEGVGKVMLVTELDEDTAYDHNVALIRANQLVEPKFIFYLLKSNLIRKEVSKLATQVGTTFLKTSSILALKLSISTVKEEQRAIAQALSDVDALIAALDKLIAKKRDLKTATMQQLLTGKKRLPGFGDGKGYKESVIGLIPEDWESCRVGDVVSFSGGSQPPRSTFIFKPRFGYLQLIQIRDYKTDTYRTYIPEELAKKKCTKEDVMIGRYGPPIFQILRGLEGAYNVALIKAIPSERIIKEFLYHFIKNDELIKLMEMLSQRSSGQTGVELPALREYPLALPSAEEQRAIATVLSDMDNEIAALESRLAKTQAIKQGMMQELLTGRTRLV